MALRDRNTNEASFYRVTPVWRNANGSQYSYVDEAFDCRNLEEVYTECEALSDNGYDSFRVEQVTESRIIEVVHD